MAITRVGVMANPPTNIDDYTHILAHLDAYAKQVGNQGMLLTQWGNASGVPAIAKGSYISHGGTLFVVDTEDFLVAAPASNGTYYLRVAGSGASLAISWVTSIGGYTWNAIYNGLYDGSENQILPYMLIKTGAVLEKWKISNLMQGGNFNRVDYLGRVIMGALASLAVNGNATVGGTLGVTGTILDKNGREVLAMKMETQQKTGSVTPGGSTPDYLISETFTFSSNVQGVVFLDIGIRVAEGATGVRREMYSVSISGSSVTVQYRAGLSSSTYNYTIVCTAAVS